MLASERFEKIVQMVNEKGIANTKELAQILNVTETTIRRDTEFLEKQGKIIRVHGGAKSINQKTVMSNQDEKDMKDRTENYEKKDEVCKKVAAFIKNGDCIFLDGGTTVAPIVKYLKGKNVKIVTNSMLVVKAFNDSDSELFVIGGKYIKEYDMSVGSIALNNLSNFNFDYRPAFKPCHKRTLSLLASVDLGETMKLFSINSLFGKIDASDVYFSSIKSRAGRLAGA